MKMKMKIKIIFLKKTKVNNNYLKTQYFIKRQNKIGINQICKKN